LCKFRYDKLISIDPGKDKIGVALLDLKGEIIYRKIIPSDKLLICLDALIKESSKILIGNGTFSTGIIKFIKEKYKSIQIIEVDEKNSTQEAKKLYFKYNPPKGLYKLFPAGLLSPTEPVDDLAAVVIARRYLKKYKNNV
jgi:RNase H-fold protein (predicted Holliday junction resolvase)